MRLFKKSAALALTAAMALSSVQLAVFAEEKNFVPDEAEETATIPTLKEFEGPAPLSAQVEELKGDELNVELSTVWGGNGAMVGGAYTLNKAARFSTTYERDAKGNLTTAGAAAAAPELAAYGDWICDYRITVESENGSINGEDVYLYGSYGGYEDIAFKCSQLAETIPDGTYEIMAWTGLDSILTYREVVNNVKTFTCGLMDNGLEPYIKISVQLVVYDGRDRTAAETKCYYVGDPVIYEKKKSVTEDSELIPVGELDAEVQEVAAVGVDNLTVEGIKDSMLATEKTKLINEYIVDNDIKSEAGEDITVNVDIFAKTEQLTPEATKFELTPYANITCGDNPSKEVEITNEQLKEDAKITVVVPAERQPLFLIHKSEGMAPEKFLPGDHTVNEREFTYSDTAHTCTFVVTHFSTVELGYAQIAITDKDAYVDNDGLGNLRFITTYGDVEPVTEFGTWIVADDIFSEGTGETYTNAADTIEYGSEFTADLMKIPSDWISHVFYAKSYVKIDNTDVWSEVESASVEDYKNNTSR